MERADALNPGHSDTLAKIAEYRNQLASRHSERSEESAFQQITLDEALHRIGGDLKLDGDLLLKFAAEDEIGGYGSAANPWPGGSVWDVEGKALYALVRALKPKIIVEVGSLVGCSTSHLAAACKKNRRLSKRAAILCHDYCHVQHGQVIAAELGPSARGILIAPSNTGLGYAVAA